MIIINLHTISDFKEFLATYRQTNHVFYEIRPVTEDIKSKKTIYFNFLGTFGSLTVLFQHISNVDGKMDINVFLEQFTSQVDIEDVSFVEGTIREIYLSIS